MSNELTPDICVIGAGSGGLSVAAAAASFGVSVVLVEKGKMGGDCLNYGCVPSKALLSAGKHAQSIRNAAVYGISASEIKVNFRKVHEHVHGVIAAIEPNDSVERFTGLGVEVIEADARFTDARTVTAGDNIIRARRFVIATGSSPFAPPIPGLDEVAYLTNETIFDNTRKMGHLIIVGGGPIGMEMAQAHHRLGCQVTVIEGERALGKDDPELAGIILENLRNEGIVIHEGAQVSQVSKKGKTGVRVTCQTNGSETVVEGTHLLIATGRVPNTENLGLEDAGIDHDRKGIKVRSDLRTSNRRVYAIGDVIGGLQFTHVANYHAGLVIRSILFRLSAKPDNNQIPWVTYTEPELGQVGLTEAQAREKHGSRIQVLRWPYEENDRAQAERKTQGLIKMVADRKGRILGVSIAGAQAGEMMNTWSLAISQGMKVRDVTGYVSPYPTLTEIGKRAAISSYAPMARSGWVRWLIGILRKFG